MNAEHTLQQKVLVKHLGQQEYLSCWQAMQNFTNQRNDATVDEIWFLEHPPIFTLGQSGDHKHVLAPGSIPVQAIDRGGQVTYHGPGQLVAYTLVDLKRKTLSIRQFVSRLEQAVIDFLAQENITALAKCQAPGVYVNDKKICSIGLRVRRGYAFHGLAFNIAMDLEPFSRINPCGYEHLQMTQLSDLNGHSDLQAASQKLLTTLAQNLGYSEIL